MEIWTPKSPGLNAGNFHETLAQHNYAAVHFWVEWSKVDDIYDDVIQNIRIEFSVIEFFSFDLGPESNWEICANCGILTVPSLILFRDGKQQKLIKGLRSKDALSYDLTHWLQNTA